MKVYIVYYCYYDDWENLGVFSSEEKAKEYIAAQHDSSNLDVEEYEVQ